MDSALLINYLFSLLKAVNFCSLVGLHAINNVEFSKRIVVTPAQSLPLVQCNHLVSNKSDQLYGEVTTHRVQH